MGDKSAENLLNSLENSKHRTLAQIIFAAGDSSGGTNVAKVLARQFHSLEALQQASYDDLVVIDEVGPKIAESITDYFQKDRHAAFLQKLAEARCTVKWRACRAKAGNAAFAGKPLC